MVQLPAKVEDVWEATREVWAYIKQKIAIDEQLPAEPELAKKLGIHRQRLRESLQSLQLLGLVERRRRAGTFRRDADSSFLVPFLHFYFDAALQGDKAQSDVVREVRAAIEGTVVEEAAERRTTTDLYRLLVAIEEQEKCQGDLQAWVAADQRFHEALVQAAHSPAMEVFAPVIVKCFASLDVEEKVCRGRWAKDILDDHRQIYKYVEEHQAEEARKAVLKHITEPHEKRGRKGKSVTPKSPRSRRR